MLNREFGTHTDACFHHSYRHVCPWYMFITAFSFIEYLSYVSYRKCFPHRTTFLIVNPLQFLFLCLQEVQLSHFTDNSMYSRTIVKLEIFQPARVLYPVSTNADVPKHTHAAMIKFNCCTDYSHSNPQTPSTVDNSPPFSSLIPQNTFTFLLTSCYALHATPIAGQRGQARDLELDPSAGGEVSRDRVCRCSAQV